MAKYRKISSKTWNDAKFRALSDNAKLVFFMLLTHPLTSSLGTLRAFPQGLAPELGWGTRVFRKAFKEIEDNGMVKCSEKDGLIWLPNFMRHNQPESPNVFRSWAGALEECPECNLKNEVFAHVEIFAKSLSEGFRKAFEEAFPKAFEEDFGEDKSNTQTEHKASEHDSKILTEEPTESMLPALVLKDLFSPEGNKIKQEAECPSNQKGYEENVSNGTEDCAACDVIQEVKKQSPPCPYERIKDLYHNAFPEHPRVTIINSTRQAHIKSRWGDAGQRLRDRGDEDSPAGRLAYFQRFFEKAARSDFLTGKIPFRDGRVYMVTFDKLMSPSGFLNVIEGKYDNRQNAW